MLRTLGNFLSKTNSLEVAWLFLWLATTSFTQRTAPESLSGGVDVTHFQRGFFLVLAILILSFALSRGIPKPRFDPVSLFLYYCGFAVFSTLWSASAVATLGKAVEISTACLIVLKTMSGPDPLFRLKRLFNWYLLISGTLVAIATIGHVVAPDVFSSGVHRITGPLLGSNSVSKGAALLSIVFLARALERQHPDAKKTGLFILYLVTGGIAVYALGRTAIVIFAVGSAMLLTRRKFLVSSLLLFPAAFLTYGIFEQVIFSYLSRGQSLEDLYALSGREVLWEWGWDAFFENPFAGFGFGVGSRVVLTKFAVRNYSDTISSLHNGLVEIVLGTGLIGLSLVGSSFLYGLWLAGRGLMRGMHMDMCIYFVALSFVSFSSTGIGGWMSSSIALFLASAGYLYLSQGWEKAIKREHILPDPANKMISAT